MLLLSIDPLYMFYIVNNQLTQHTFSFLGKYKLQHLLKEHQDCTREQ